MTPYEDAAKVVEQVLANFPGAWVGGRQREAFPNPPARTAMRETVMKKPLLCRIGIHLWAHDVTPGGGIMLRKFYCLRCGKESHP